MPRGNRAGKMSALPEHGPPLLNQSQSVGAWLFGLVDGVG
jgi:hypothetical protein